MQQASSFLEFSRSSLPEGAEKPKGGRLRVCITLCALLLDKSNLVALTQKGAWKNVVLAISAVSDLHQELKFVLRSATLPSLILT